MEKRAASIGLPRGALKYIFPDNGGLRDDDIDEARKLGIDEQIVTDIHVGASGALGEAEKLFERHADFHQSAVNLETNAGTHTHLRALQEAADLNDFFNAPSETQRRVLARTASFCTSRSGHFDAFDQGLSFFLPNMTWLQPPGHVHAMIASTRQWNALGVEVDQGALRAATVHQANEASAAASSSMFSASAQSSGRKDTFVVRVVNPLAEPIGPNGTISLELKVELDAAAGCTTCTAHTLSHHDTSAANPSWAPNLISPTAMPCSVTDGASAVLPLGEFSYTVVEFTGCKARAQGLATHI